MADRRAGDPGLHLVLHGALLGRNRRTGAHGSLDSRALSADSNQGSTSDRNSTSGANQPLSQFLS
ncbi:MAG TPA: hypothetical protein VH369_12380, partial [Bryobacteraceae bacterium]